MRRSAWTPRHAGQRGALVQTALLPGPQGTRQPGDPKAKPGEEGPLWRRAREGLGWGAGGGSQGTEQGPRRPGRARSVPAGQEMWRSLACWTPRYRAWEKERGAQAGPCGFGLHAGATS